MDVEALMRSSSRLGEAAFDTNLWPELLQQIAENLGAFGAMLLQAGVPTSDMPWSPSLGRHREDYYREGWNTRDLRAARSVAAFRRGLTVLTDEDLVSRDEAEREPFYTSFLASHGSAAFVAVGFPLSASEMCGLVLHRTSSQGQFSDREIEALRLLGLPLTAATGLARMVGERSLHASLDVLDQMSRPAIALDRTGAVVTFNTAAAALFDEDFRVRGGMLVVFDQRAQAGIRRACEMAAGPFTMPVWTEQSIVARRRGRLPLILRPLPLEGSTASFVSGARLLITITDPDNAGSPSLAILQGAFGMTKAEAKLAAHLASGLSLQQAAGVSGIALETARAQLRAIFSKTDTNRQAELVILLNRF